MKKTGIFSFAVAAVAACSFCGCAEHTAGALDPDWISRELSVGETDASANDARGVSSVCDALVFKVGKDEIYGQILKPDDVFGPNRPCVIFCHGFAGFTRFDDLAHSLCRAGCVVVIPHHRGAWGSQGVYSVPHCIEDAAYLARYVRSANFRQKYRTDSKALFIAGYCMGGNTAINSAKYLGDVAGVILLAPYNVGAFAKTTPYTKFRSFLVENGAEVLHTDGVDPLIKEMIDHAQEMEFSAMAEAFPRKAVFLAVPLYDKVVPASSHDAYWKAFTGTPDATLRVRKDYRAGHDFMGVRLQLARDVADFINLAVATKGMPVLVKKK